jgi:pimeloyl-ACP methyl ester carboxylesterase
MQASQNFMKLATDLSDAFTLYVPDRRGRGSSGPPGDDYGIRKECEDIDAFVAGFGVQNVFGLSSGALIALQAALTLPAIRKTALYEPPLSIKHSSPTAWLTRFDQEIAQGKLGAALVTVLKGLRVLGAVWRARLGYGRSSSAYSEVQRASWLSERRLDQLQK